MVAASRDLFEIFVPKRDAETEPRYYLRVREWAWPNGYTRDDALVCLTLDTVDIDEFDSSVDEVIAQLRELKRKARRKMGAASCIQS